MMNEPLLDQPPSFSSSLLLNLYVGHFLARWGARMWEFSVGLYMINVWPDSLLLAAAYGVVESASTALLGPFIGQLVDKLSYIQVLRLWLLSQNLSFMVAGEGQPPGVLTKMNSIIRRIDLSCKLFAPVVTGFIISFVSLTASALVLALWNVLSVCLQYWLLMSVYNGIPQLKVISQRRASRSPVREVNERLIFSDTNESEQSSRGTTMIEQFLNLPYISAWRLYIKQDFRTLMTAALEWQGIPAYVIGIARGIGATVGIAATFLYPVLQSRISTLRTGLWSIWSQWACLLLCVASVFVKENSYQRFLEIDDVIVPACDAGSYFVQSTYLSCEEASTSLGQATCADSMILGGLFSEMEDGVYCFPVQFQPVRAEGRRRMTGYDEDGRVPEDLIGRCWASFLGKTFTVGPMWKWTCLLLCVASVFVKEKLVSAYLLIGSCSRIPSLCRWRCSKLTSVCPGLDDLYYGHNNLQSKGFLEIDDVIVPARDVGSYFVQSTYLSCEEASTSLGQATCADSMGSFPKWRMEFIAFQFSFSLSGQRDDVV
ncbi:hypothetical protein DH2020_001653 [Rehmannia glutinosa]|uniref:Solute carrier family 40 member n=1 Tax=Rehmannia glutinosa TaxID=99300 RepID=A0ABR0Y0U9_REHGL